MESCRTDGLSKTRWGLACVDSAVLLSNIVDLKNASVPSKCLDVLRWWNYFNAIDMPCNARWRIRINLSLQSTNNQRFHKHNHLKMVLAITNSQWRETRNKKFHISTKQQNTTYIATLCSGTRVSRLSGTVNVGTTSLVTTCFEVVIVTAAGFNGISTNFPFATNILLNLIGQS